MLYGRLFNAELPAPHKGLAAKFQEDALILHGLNKIQTAAR
jgi:hypothetical protein